MRGGTGAYPATGTHPPPTPTTLLCPVTTLGRGDNSSFWNLNFAEVLYYVEWDLHHNLLFVVGNRVWDQIRGVAIGGPLRARLASMFYMVREAKFYERGEEAVEKSIRRFLLYKSLPVKPFQLRDSIVGMGEGSTPCPPFGHRPSRPSHFPMYPSCTKISCPSPLVPNHVCEPTCVLCYSTTLLSELRVHFPPITLG